MEMWRGRLQKSTVHIMEKFSGFYLPLMAHNVQDTQVTVSSNLPNMEKG